MNEEELFCKLFPEYVVNGKPLSPYFDLFESGYEQSENRMAELEAQIEKMKCCMNDLVHLGEFNEHTDEEYFNYQVHEALNNAGQFIKEIKEK